jgi:hypothetical protein
MLKVSPPSSRCGTTCTVRRNVHESLATKVRAHRAPNLLRGCVGRSNVESHRSAQRLRWLLRSIRPKRASYRDLPPENGSSGRGRVSWPLAFGGMGWGRKSTKSNPIADLPYRSSPSPLRQRSRDTRSTQASGRRGGFTYKSGPTVLTPFSLRSMIPAMPRLSHNQGQLENLQKKREQPVLKTAPSGVSRVWERS